MSSSIPQSNDSKSAEHSRQERGYAVPHDLGASAQTIKGFADLLTRRYAESLDTDGQNFTADVEGGDRSASSTGMLAGVLASRVESRGQPLSPTDVGEVWQSVKPANAARIREAAASVEQDQLPIVLADAKQLAQRLSELLANSLKFRRDEPLRVRLAAERIETGHTASRSLWQFRLTNNGPGIASQHLARVSQMFQRCCPEWGPAWRSLSESCNVMAARSGQNPPLELALRSASHYLRSGNSEQLLASARSSP